MNVNITNNKELHNLTQYGLTTFGSTESENYGCNPDFSGTDNGIISYPSSGAPGKCFVCPSSGGGSNAFSISGISLVPPAGGGALGSLMGTGATGSSTGSDAL